MAKTYFLARMKDGRTVIRGSAADYGYTIAYPAPGWDGRKISFSRHFTNVPADCMAQAVPVEKVDGKTARQMLKDGTAQGSV